MPAIELMGRITEQGKLEFELPANLPPGEVQITIRPISDEEIAADEALWDKQFAKSQDVLERMADEAHEDYLAGRTLDCDEDDEV